MRRVRRFYCYNNTKIPYFQGLGPVEEAIELSRHYCRRRQTDPGLSRAEPSRFYFDVHTTGTVMSEKRSAFTPLLHGKSLKYSRLMHKKYFFRKGVYHHPRSIRTRRKYSIRVRRNCRRIRFSM